MITTVQSTPLSERRLAHAMEIAPRAAQLATDTYVSAATTVALPALSQWHPTGALGTNVAASAEQMRGMLPALNGIMAAGHGILGLVYLFSDTNLQEGTAAFNARRLKGIGELITGVGMAGQAAGLGLWALPITVVGIVSATVGDVIQIKNS